MLKLLFDQHAGKASRFAVIGALGFVVDASILTLLFNVLDYNLYIARLISFSMATLVTWLLNRLYTFHAHIPVINSKSKEYGRYLAVQIGGALINLLVFVVVIALLPQLEKIAVIPLAIGALFGLLFNYTCTHYWVYKKVNHD